jgi:hypothetical protein
LGRSSVNSTGGRGGNFERGAPAINKKAETTRDRRLTREDEGNLLDAALTQMNTPEHQQTAAFGHSATSPFDSLRSLRASRNL